jgi:Xaa-Pro aminopeptidase
MNQDSDLQNKLARLRHLLEDQDVDYILIERQENFSWLTSGRGFIGLASTGACASFLVGKDKAYMLANNIEMDRLRKEQRCESALFCYRQFPWYEPWRKSEIIKEIVKNARIAEDSCLEEKFIMLRSVLDVAEIASLRETAQETARICEDTCFSISKGIDEYSLAGSLSEAFWKKNLEPITLLIGFDERALQFRHPVPTGKRLENYALIAVCTRRNGLICSVTRLVSLRKDFELEKKQKSVGYLDALLQSKTYAGNTLDAIFHTLLEGYAHVGHPDEWKAHHQGGLSGFLAREIKADQNAKHTVRMHEVYAFNPTIKGSKAENTILVTADGNENLTHTGRYPYYEYTLDGKRYESEKILIINE